MLGLIKRTFSTKDPSILLRLYKNINDIDDCVAGKILKFADDTKIYHTVYSDEDVSAL